MRYILTGKMKPSNNPPNHGAQETLYLHVIPQLALYHSNNIPLNVPPFLKTIRLGIPSCTMNIV